jgi:hypothetical protein
MASPPTNPGAINATVTEESPNDTEVMDGVPATTGLMVKLLETSEAAA